LNSTGRDAHRAFTEVLREERRGGPTNMDALEWLRRHLDADGRDLL
jgi:hypothetical protein